MDMHGDQVAAGSWWDIWTAGIAVNTLCVRKGKEGFAFGLGKLDFNLLS